MTWVSDKITDTQHTDRLLLDGIIDGIMDTQKKQKFGMICL